MPISNSQPQTPSLLPDDPESELRRIRAASALLTLAIIGLMTPALPVAQADPADAPLPPIDVTATLSDDNTTITITWQPPPLIADGITNYTVYRIQGPSLGVPIGNVSADTTTIIDRAYDKTQPVMYYVVSQNPYGTSPPSPDSKPIFPCAPFVIIIGGSPPIWVGYNPECA